MEQKIVIIGGGAGGMTCAAQLIKLLPNDEIILFEKGPYVGWAGCPTPYYISGELSFNSVVHNTPDFFREKGIKVYENHEVKLINFQEKFIEVEGENIKGSFSYDKLILSLGGKAIIPNFTGYKEGIENIFRLSHALDAEKIKDFVVTKNPKKAIIVGGGFIGLEMAEALKFDYMDIELIELQETLFPRLNKSVSDELIKKAGEKSIKLRLGEKVSEIIHENNIFKGVVLDSGEKVEGDMLLMAIGITPNLDLLVKSDFHFSEGNRVYVNEYMETDIEDVYALGDLVFNEHKMTGKMVYAPFGDVADKQAILLTKHLSGKSIPWKGVSGSFAFSFFNLKVAGTGLNLDEAKAFGYNAKERYIKAFSKVGGFGSDYTSKINVIYDEDTKLILGAFGIGKEAVAQFIDQFAIVITMKIPIDELFNIDFPYSPTNSSVWNPLLALYRVVMK